MVTATANKGIDTVKTAIGMLKSSKVSGSRKALTVFLLAIGGLYVVSPVDFIPDAIPLAGVFDDWMITLPGLAALVSALKKASRMPDLPWYESVFGFALASAYVFSPIDFVPDAIPFLGTLDDLCFHW